MESAEERAERTAFGFARLRLQTRSLDEQRAFYHKTLHLPMHQETRDSVTIQAGSTLLTFVQTDAPERPFYHFAFNIPENKLPLAKTWLAKRTRLLARDGQDEFPFPNWNAHAIYFLDPAGNIGEFIARHTLPNARPGPFAVEDILYVSELGLVVESVPETVARLKAQAGLSPYRQGGEDFQPVGDAHQLLIVARRERVWFPTLDRKAGVFSTAASLRGDRSASLPLPGYPYALEIQRGRSNQATSSPAS